MKKQDLCSGSLLVDNSPSASCIFACFVAETLMHFILHYLFKVICKANSLGRWRYCLLLEERRDLFVCSAIKMSPSQSSGCIVAHYKISGLPNPVVLSRNTTYFMWRGHLTLLHLLVRIRTQNTNINADTQANTIAVSNKTPLVSDLGVSRLLTTSMIPWQADLLAFM